jgi:hypothetical protein
MSNWFEALEQQPPHERAELEYRAVRQPVYNAWVWRSISARTPEGYVVLLNQQIVEDLPTPSAVNVILQTAGVALTGWLANTEATAPLAARQAAETRLWQEYHAARQSLWEKHNAALDACAEECKQAMKAIRLHALQEMGAETETSTTSEEKEKGVSDGREV